MRARLHSIGDGAVATSREIGRTLGPASHDDDLWHAARFLLALAQFVLTARRSGSRRVGMGFHSGTAVLACGAFRSASSFSLSSFRASVAQAKTHCTPRDLSGRPGGRWASSS
ncbi:hypothetical protein [Streptomyces peucetius]|uniref:Uncharacterized protein n=1 Tax=Streptomyces peucetius TaxID=1950 RepID=A0ABY6I2D9_STRPE|nr:hypothetical protein [Streptomyces peucetius]UYQ60032.1 hypothetical protein OGH68_00030 [Streptomyces peucetius]